MYRGKCIAGDDAKEFREQRNLTQWQMAELLGIAEITLRKWEARGFASCPERATKLFMSVLEREDAGTLEVPEPKPLGRPKKLRIKPPEPKPQPLSDEDAVLLDQVRSDWRVASADYDGLKFTVMLNDGLSLDGENKCPGFRAPNMERIEDFMSRIRSL